MSHFNTFPHTKAGTNAPKIGKLNKPDNYSVPTIPRRKRRLLEVISSANDAEKDHKELLELVRYASISGIGAQNALNCFAYPDGTKACRNLTVRQVEHAIKYVAPTSFTCILFSHIHLLESEYLDASYNICYMYCLPIDLPMPLFSFASLGNRRATQRETDALF